MTTQVQYNKCLLDGKYAEFSELCPTPTQAYCDSCAFTLPPVEGATKPVIKTLQAKTFPLGARLDDSHPNKLAQAQNQYPSPDPHSPTPILFSAKPDQVPTARHGDPALFSLQSQQTPRKGPDPPRIESQLQPQPTIPCRKSSTDDDVFADFAPNDYNHSLEPYSPTRSQDTIPSESQITEQIGTILGPNFTRSASPVSYRSGSINRQDDPFKGVPHSVGMIEEAKSIITGRVRPHDHEIVYTSTKEPLTRELRVVLNNVSIEIFSIEASVGAFVTSTPGSGCTVAHRFELVDPTARGRVRKYALVAWDKDKRLMRPLETVILSQFSQIASQMSIGGSWNLSLSSARQSGSTTIPRTVSSWLSGGGQTNTVLQSAGSSRGVASFLLPRESTTPSEDGSIDGSPFPFPNSGSSSPTVQASPRNLADIVNNDKVFAHLHAAFCPLLSMFLDF